MGLYPHQPLNGKPMCLIDDCCTIVQGWVDPREKSVIVSCLSGFLKRAQNSVKIRPRKACNYPNLRSFG